MNFKFIRALFALSFLVGMNPIHSIAVVVNNVDGLKEAIDQIHLNPEMDCTILLEDGIYHLKWGKLNIRRDGVTLKSKSGKREAVILRGQKGMLGGQIEFIFDISASDVTLRDMTLENVGSHAVIIHGETPNGAHRTTLKNLVIRDTFEQMVKVTPSNKDPKKFYSEGGVLEDSLLEYSAGIGPQFYIGGIDAHAAKDWIVRHNVFKNIISPSGSVAEHAVHFWSWSQGTLVENNLIINCDRGIGLGLSDSGHTRGVIRNNIVFHNDENRGGHADVSIEVLHCEGAQIYNNTIWQAHTNYFSAIKNFKSSGVTIANNLIHMHPHSYWKLQQAIWVHEGSRNVVSNSINAPNPQWFAAMDPEKILRVNETGDFLRIRETFQVEVMDRGTTLSSVVPLPFSDFKGIVRPQGKAPDIGAHEFQSK